MRRSTLVLASSLVALPAFAGPLNPPAGPIASTPGPEPRTPINSVNTAGDANSVYRISQPGSYYLTGNVTGVSGKATIEVAASNVTIDLNGFNLAGVAGGIAAVRNDGAVKSVNVMNGSVSGWTMDGIDFEDVADVTGAVIRDVAFSACEGTGVTVGPGSTIESCTFVNCGTGVYAESGSVVRNCTLSEVVAQGIGVRSNSLVEGCVLSTSGSTGSAHINGLGENCVIRQCTTSGGFMGISVEPNSVVEDNTISGTTNLGIAGASNIRVMGNTIDDCDSAGIWIRGSFCVIADNTIRNIRATGGGASGIYSTTNEQRNTIRGNSIISCDIGLEIKGGGNAIYKNELTGNTKHADIVANNRVGPMATGTLSPAINGSTGGNGMGSTDPTANIIY